MEPSSSFWTSAIMLMGNDPSQVPRGDPETREP